MSMLYIGKNMVELSREQIKRKITLWNEYYPNLKFDKDGRCVINSSQVEHKEKYLEKEVELYFNTNKIKNTSAEFINAFNIYLKNKNYKMFTNNFKYTSDIQSGEDIDLVVISVSNNFIFKYSYNIKDKIQTKELRIKVSKVLAEVQRYWLELVPEYNILTTKIKELRKNGYCSENIELSNLIEQKKELEKGNLYFDFQKIYNNINENNTLYLSINPLDFLTSSGSIECVDNPTKFSTCMSLRFDLYKTCIRVLTVGGYSSPKLQYLLGQVINRGIIYTKNGNTLKVPNTDFEFLGYSKRGNVWLDDKGVLVERQYPKDNSLEKEINNCKLKIIDLSTFIFNHPLDFSNIFSINDINKIATLIEMIDELNENIYFDSVMINKYYHIVYLPKLRKSYFTCGDGYNNPGVTCSCGKVLYGNEKEDFEFINNDFYCSNCINDFF